jgi:recombinational DNA repair protein RecR
MTKQEIAERLADKWLDSDEAKKILKSITINIDELKHRICDRMIQEIILNWKENKDVY